MAHSPTNEPWLTILCGIVDGFPKLVSQEKPYSDISPIKNPPIPVWMAYKDQSSFGITVILYTYQAYKALFGPIKSTNPSVRMAYKARSV